LIELVIGHSSLVGWEGAKVLCDSGIDRKGIAVAEGQNRSFLVFLLTNDQ
jgi:hypothetical protein